MKRFRGLAALALIVVIVFVLYSSAVFAESNEWTCPSCGAIVSGNFCSACGAQRPVAAEASTDEWICSNCGATATGNFCYNCGQARNAGSTGSDAQPVQDLSEAVSDNLAAGASGQISQQNIQHDRQEAYMDFVSSDVSAYPNVRLYFEYTDDYGEPIALTTVTGEVIESISGGAEIERTVRKIQKLEGNQGLSIDIVADKSGSMDMDLPQMQSIMSDFVASLDYSLGDKAEILSFDSYVMYMCTYTQNVNLLQNGIYNMVADGETALYDALVTGIMNAGSQAGARCVIGFTDGEDNASSSSVQDVISYAVQREVPVYLIGASWADDTTLEYICEQTGGFYWNIDNIYDVGEILQEIYSTQKDMYCIEYESDPNADPYAQRRISCSLWDDSYIGRITGLSFQATPVIRQAAHSSRYEIFREDVSWTQANNACIAKGGHLATITSQAEMDQLVSMCEGAGIKYCWIGGYTSIRNGSAFGHWITGEPFSYTAWFPGEPSRNDMDGTPEFYLMLWKVEDSWSWNDQRDDVLASGLDYFKGNIGYICEYE